MAITLNLVNVGKGLWQIEANNGRRWVHNHLFTNVEAGNTFLAKLRANVDKINPANSPYWSAVKTPDDLCLVIYDVPTRATRAGCPSPRARMRRKAIFINKSGCLIRRQDIPYNWLNQIQAKYPGVEWYEVKQDMTEAAKLARIMADTLRRELQDAIARIKRVQSKADAKIRSEESAADYQAKVEGALKRAQALAKDLVEAAKRLGISESVLDLPTIGKAREAIHGAMQARMAAYTAGTKKARQKGLQVAQAAEEDDIPAEILADALRDAGEDATADEIQEAFAS